MLTLTCSGNKQFADIIHRSQAEREEASKVYELRGGRSITKSEYKAKPQSPRKACGLESNGKNQYWNDMVLFLLGSAAAALMLYWACFRTVPFCDSTPDDSFSSAQRCQQADGCMPCPMHAQCAGGKMVSANQP